MVNDTSIKVSSHVARDFLQNAAYFNTMPKIVWEYVSNSLDAARDGDLTIVAVDLTSKWLRIADNGCGMTRTELNNFFQMHGQNLQRKRGKRVRGRFGTGKCAAFGLANYLRIDTSQGGVRNVVELSRKDIERAKSGEAFPVRDVLTNEISDGDDGTIVEIRDLNISRVDVDKVIEYVEKHLSRYRQKARVIVNGHECRFEEIQYLHRHIFQPPDDVAKHIGNVDLVAKISPKPLDEDSRGIDILSNGIWHGTTLAGLEGRERASYIFGEIDVPILEDGEWPIPAFDNTRNNTLNPQNPVVAVLLGWLSEELEIVRQELVRIEKERKRSAEAKKLEEEARRIAAILNEDFDQLEIELELARKVAKRSGQTPIDETADDEGELWPGNGEEPTGWQQTGSPRSDGKRGSEAGAGSEVRPGPTVEPGNEPGARKETTDGTRKRRRGIFTIEYVNHLPDHKRSTYDAKTKTISINLDHPQIANAFEAAGRNPEDPQFRQISYEVAAVEYAIAVPSERIERDEFYGAQEALFDVIDIIDRVTRKLISMLYT